MLDNSNICFIPAVVPVNCFFSFNLRFLWFFFLFSRWVIFKYIIDIFCAVLWDSGPYLKFYFSKPILCQERNGIKEPPHYHWVVMKVQKERVVNALLPPSSGGCQGPPLSLTDVRWGKVVGFFPWCIFGVE